MSIRPEQRVLIDVSGLHRPTVSVVSGPRWVDGVVSLVDEESRRVTVMLQHPLDGKKSLRVAISRIKAA